MTGSSTGAAADQTRVGGLDESARRQDWDLTFHRFIDCVCKPRMGPLGR